METAKLIILYLLLLDSVAANAMAWFGESWYIRHFRVLSRYFPISKGWTAYYLVLVLWVGFLTFAAR